jgi:1-deoxy-D-xylulose-5-phosphate reductoisomerase
VKTDSTRVVILGSTGSIGTQALDVIKQHPDLFEVVGLAAGSNREAIAHQAKDMGVTRIALGADDTLELASLDQADVVLNAVVGAAGLAASIAALQAGKTLALANKESLVAGGEACLTAAGDGGGRIVPVDSEHAALAQCLQACSSDAVDRIVLTASGGPFRDRTDLDGVTREEALAHPTWSMGSKITIDSATMMNKGLEIIEAHLLFGVDYNRIGVIVHPQSAVHGIVELVDGSTMMQAAPTDMRIPILWALNGGRTSLSEHAPLDLGAIGSLDFEEVDSERFPAVELAREAGKRGGSYPAVLNAANEVAVNAFLEGAISFTAITAVVGKVIALHQPAPVGNLDEVLEVDDWARGAAEGVVAAQAVSSNDKDRVLGQIK